MYIFKSIILYTPLPTNCIRICIAITVKVLVTIISSYNYLYKQYVYTILLLWFTQSSICIGTSNIHNM